MKRHIGPGGESPEGRGLCCLSTESSHVTLLAYRCLQQPGSSSELPSQSFYWHFVTKPRFSCSPLKPIIREASVSRKERCFNQESRQSGEIVDSCPETSSEDSAEPWQLLKGKMEGGRISVNHWGRRLHSASFSTECRLADTLQMLSCLHGLLAGLLRGLLRVES